MNPLVLPMALFAVNVERLRKVKLPAAGQQARRQIRFWQSDARPWHGEPKKNLAERGFGDIEVNMSGGYDPATTSASSLLIQKEMAAFHAMGIKPLLWPRGGGSWPGYDFTNAPLSLPAGHSGLGRN